MLKPNGMPNLMNSRGHPITVRRQIPSKVHRPLRPWNRQNIPTHIRPGSIPMVEPNPYHRILHTCHLLERKPNTQVLPRLKRLPNHLLLRLLPFQESKRQLRSIDPFRPTGQYKPNPIRRNPRLKRSLNRYRLPTQPLLDKFSCHNFSGF